MLCANLCAANFLSAKELPLLYRVHPEPEEEKKFKLRQFLISIDIDLGEGKLIDYQRVLEALLGSNGCRAIQLQVLRSMQQAAYKPKTRVILGWDMTNIPTLPHRFVVTLI